MSEKLSKVLNEKENAVNERNILFYCRKGGQGKTTHAIGYAEHNNATYYTNDFDNGTPEIYGNLFEEGKLKELRPDQDIEIDDTDNNVFDFGGFIDKRVIDVAKFVDFCVVPICYQSSADLTPGVQTIIELQKHNENIVILINNTEKDLAKELEEQLKENFDYPIFVVSKSRIINRLADEGKTVFDLFSKGGLEKYMVRNLVPQLTSLYAYLNNQDN